MVEKILAELQSKLNDKKVSLSVDNPAKDWLVTRGYDKIMGARPMHRLVKETLKKPLAEELLFGGLSTNGGKVKVTVENNEIKITVN